VTERRRPPAAENPNARARRLIALGFSEDYATRKGQPVATGVLDYFPLAMIAISEVSRAGNEQHNPGEPLHWERTKSADEANTAIRHFMQRGTLDTDGTRHMAKACWRFLALLEKEIEDAIERNLVADCVAVTEAPAQEVTESEPIPACICDPHGSPNPNCPAIRFTK
jgi:dATP/dGTP diphosphohydrolase